jgi:diguanylate cyclase (GGDEF)-like protein
MTDDIHQLGMLVQAGGAALIGLATGLMHPGHRHPSLRLWLGAWLALAAGLVALTADLAWPGWSVVLQPAYLFGEYLFLYLLVLGCARLAGARFAPRRGTGLALALPALVLAAAIPALAGYRFAPMFLVQSVLLALGFSVALLALMPALRRPGAGFGVRLMAVSLALLVATFAQYLPVFALHLGWGHPLPMGWLRVTSAAHLLFEFALGLGGAMAVLEQLNGVLRQRNADLAKSGRHYQELARRDHLTGAQNRRGFADAQARLDSHGCLAMVDIDHLKLINDRLGHGEGDRALRLVADRLRRLARGEDQLFRWGGDELLLLMPRMPRVVLEQRLDDLNRELRSGAHWSDPLVPALGISYGVVEYRHDDGSLDRSIEAADQAMYASRRRRRAVPPQPLST